jgi:hypothetical protein
MLIYIAEVSTKVADENITQFVYDIQKATGLLDIYAAKKALIKIPKSIKMKNSDLNIEKEFEFEQPFAEGLVELQTIANDKIQISLGVQASGSKIISRTAYETNNESLTPEQYSTDALLKINELNYSLIFSGPFDYNGFDVNILQTALLNEIPEINYARIELDTFEPTIYLGILKTAFNSSHDQNTVKELFEKNIGNLLVVNKLDFGEDENKLIIKIEVNDQENYGFVVSMISEYMKDFGFTDDEFAVKPITATILGETKFDTKELHDKALEIEKIMSDNQIAIIARQKAIVSLEEPLSVKDQNYIYDQNFTGLLIPKHNEGDNYKIKVNFIMQRGKIMVQDGIPMIQAVENKDLIDILKEKPVVVKTE